MPAEASKPAEASNPAQVQKLFAITFALTLVPIFGVPISKPVSMPEAMPVSKPRIWSKEARRMMPSRVPCGRPSRPTAARPMVSRRTGKSHESPCEFKLLVFRTESLEFQPECLSRRLGKLAANLSPRRTAEATANGRPDHRQGLARGAFQHTNQLTAGGCGGNIFGGAGYSINQIAQELLQLLLIGNVQEFSRGIHFFLFGQRSTRCRWARGWGRGSGWWLTSV
jgi:hypothetical protein